MSFLDLSIVIVSWNTQDVLRDCLRSTFANLGALRAEVIVVDNASSDGSADMVAREFPRAVLVRNPTNAGFAAANNVGFRIARGRHVLLLNSDTVVLGDVITRSVRWLDADPDVGVMGCRVLNPDRTMQPTCFGYPHFVDLLWMTAGLHELPWPRFLGRYQLRGWRRDTERDVEVVTGCYMLVRRVAMDQVGELDEGFFFCGEETDWCERFKRAGWRIVFTPVGEIVHIGNASGRKLDSRRDVLLTAGLVRLHRKHGGVLGLVSVGALLWFFNASRWLGWSLIAAFGRGRDARRRRDHFRGVLRGFGEVWQRAMSASPNARLLAPSVQR